MDLAGAELTHEFVHLLFELGAQELILVGLAGVLDGVPDQAHLIGGGLRDRADELLGGFVLVLGPEVEGGVLHVALRVGDDEVEAQALGEFENLVVLELLLHLLDDGLVGGVLDAAAVIEEGEYALVLVEEVEDRLVVGEADVLEGVLKSLFSELFLLVFEHVGQVELLKVLVGVVDAELLERVLREVLEPENIEEADAEHLKVVLLVRANVDGLIEAVDEPLEEAVVEDFREGVDLAHHLVLALGGADDLLGDLSPLEEEALGEGLEVAAQEGADLLEVLDVEDGAGRLALVKIGVVDVDVSEFEHSSEDGPGGGVRGRD